MTSAFSQENYVSLWPTVLYSKVKYSCYSKCFLTSYFCIPVPYNEKDISFGCQFQKVLQVFIEPFDFSFFSVSGWAQTWITMMLNGWFWKQTEVILSFLKVHSSIIFQILLLTMKTTPFLLRDHYIPQGKNIHNDHLYYIDHLY